MDLERSSNNINSYCLFEQEDQNMDQSQKDQNIELVCQNNSKQLLNQQNIAMQIVLSQENLNFQWNTQIKTFIDQYNQDQQLYTSLNNVRIQYEQCQTLLLKEFNDALKQLQTVQGQNDNIYAQLQKIKSFMQQNFDNLFFQLQQNVNQSLQQLQQQQQQQLFQQIQCQQQIQNQLQQTSINNIETQQQIVEEQYHTPCSTDQSVSTQNIIKKQKQNNKLWLQIDQVFYPTLEKLQYQGYFYTQLFNGKKTQYRFYCFYETTLFQFEDKINTSINLIEEQQETIQYPVGCLSLDFNTKFTTLRNENNQIIGFQLERNNLQYIMYCDDQEQANQWYYHFSQKLVQRNFHQLFRAQAKIGKGNFGKVYKAKSVINGLDYAVKAYQKNLISKRENGLESVINEINILRLLDNDNVVRLHEVYETENSIYLIMSLKFGGSLSQLLNKKDKLSSQQIKQIMKTLIQGINYIHNNNIMHRDLKPENILFNNIDELNAVIADFGLATRVDNDKHLYNSCGTPGFVAPEILNQREQSQTQKVDVYSAGIILHILLTGSSPFTSKNIKRVIQLNKRSNINWQDRQYLKLNIIEFDLLNLMLQPDPNKRISSDQISLHPYFSENINNQQAYEIQQRNLYFYNAQVTARQTIQYSPNPQIISPELTLQTSFCTNNESNIDLYINTNPMVIKQENDFEAISEFESPSLKNAVAVRNLNSSNISTSCRDDSQKSQNQKILQKMNEKYYKPKNQIIYEDEDDFVGYTQEPQKKSNDKVKQVKRTLQDNI